MRGDLIRLRVGSQGAFDADDGVRVVRQVSRVLLFEVFQKVGRALDASVSGMAIMCAETTGPLLG